MRILWHSLAAPWVGSGYGTQTSTWTRYLRDRGHQVAISTGSMLAGTTITWEGMEVLPAPLDGQVHTLLPYHVEAAKPDVTILLTDLHPVPPQLLARVPGKVLAWIPIDTMRQVSLLDFYLLQQAPNVTPVAMSKHGQALLAKAGIDAPCIPHGIDTFAAWTPSPDRAATRRELGLPEGTFLVGINSNNSDPYRKGYHEQMEAFRILATSHPEARLVIHTFIRQKGSVDLEVMATALGIRDKIIWSNQERMEAGAYSQDFMAAWYSAMDVVSNCSLGEGFGLAAIESQACGTPVILSAGSTGPELVGPGTLVDVQPFWNPVHQAQWHMPLVGSVTRAYYWAQQAAGRKREQARDFATTYDVQNIGPLWDELLASL